MVINIYCILNDITYFIPGEILINFMLILLMILSLSEYFSNKKKLVIDITSFKVLV